MNHILIVWDSGDYTLQYYAIPESEITNEDRKQLELANDRRLGGVDNEEVNDAINYIGVRLLTFSEDAPSQAQGIWGGGKVTSPIKGKIITEVYDTGMIP